jgi:hypothetical protein
MLTAKSKQVRLITPSKPIQGSPPAKPTQKIRPEIPKVKCANTLRSECRARRTPGPN